MNADFGDPRWIYIAPAYAISALALGWLAVRAFIRLRQAERRHKDLP